MALFGKKTWSLDEVLKAIDTLSPEDKEKVKAKMEDLYKAEDEREVDKIEEEKTDSAEVKDEKGEEVDEESEEIGKDVDEVESEVQDNKAADTEEKSDELSPADVPADTQQDKLANDNSAKVIEALTERVSSLEEELKELSELKELMQEFTSKQAKQYGYQGAVPGAKKSMDEMSAAELKKSILNGEY